LFANFDDPCQNVPQPKHHQTFDFGTVFEVSSCIPFDRFGIGEGSYGNRKHSNQLKRHSPQFSVANIRAILFESDSKHQGDAPLKSLFLIINFTI
jgi:hypothetical protein